MSTEAIRMFRDDHASSRANKLLLTAKAAFTKHVQKTFLIALVLLLTACSGEAPETNRIERIETLRSAGDFQAALTEVRMAIKDDPDNAQLHRLQGNLYEDTQNWALAEISLKNAIELGADSAELQLELSRVLFGQNKFLDTIKLLESLAFSSNLSAIEADIRHAKALDKTNDDVLAGRLFAKVIKQVDRGTLPFNDPVDDAELFRSLEAERNNYPSLSQILENRERLQNLPIGEWVTLHKQRASDTVFFARQDHGGGTFDTKRGQLILFGSDTHGYGDIAGKNWLNSLFFFDPVAGEWTQSYPHDSLDTYQVNAEGIPVAGANGDHPWAMHTYGAVSYDAKLDQVVVSSHPAHLVPGKFTYILEDVWPKIRRHPTWTYDLQTERWTYLAAEAESFFHHATAYDADRSVIVGYRGDGVFELSGSPRRWLKVQERGLLAPDNNLVYDAKHKALVIFGGGGYTNDVAIYDPATGRHEIMPTPGIRPPNTRHVPMAFHPGIGKSVMLVQRIAGNDPLAGTTETWVYDLGEDTWARIETADLDMGIYRNYNLEYDPIHNILLFVPNPYGPLSLTRVLALRL